MHTYIRYVHFKTFLIGPPALTVNIMKNIESSSIVVQWDELDDSLPTAYVVTWTSERDLNNVQVKTLIEQSPYTITGLTLDTVYTITVTASNKCGTGLEYSTSVSLTTDATSSISAASTVVNPVITTTIVNTSTTTAVITFSTSTSTTTTKVTTIGVINLNSMTTPVTNPSTADTTTNTIISSTTTNRDTTTTGIFNSSSIVVMTTVVKEFCTTTTNIVMSCMSSTTIGNSTETASKLSSTK